MLFWIIFIDTYGHFDLYRKQLRLLTPEATLVGMPGCLSNLKQKICRKALKRMPKNILDRIIWKKACVLAAWDVIDAAGRVF